MPQLAASCNQYEQNIAKRAAVQSRSFCRSAFEPAAALGKLSRLSVLPHAEQCLYVGAAHLFASFLSGGAHLNFVSPSAMFSALNSR